MSINTSPSTLTTIERGVSRSIFTISPGDYIWHRGAYRRVTRRDGTTVRMGRHVLHSTHCSTVEALR